MTTSSWIAFRSLLERSDPEQQSTLFRHLSSGDQEQVRAAPLSKTDPFVRLYSMEERLERIHYSWLIPFFEPFREADKEMILSALSAPQIKRLQKHFKLSSPVSPLKEPAKKYLVSALYRWLTSDQKGFLPLEFLPDHPLNPLLELTKKQIQELVDYLGLHDLAVEMKHVIKSEQIKKIQQTLSQSKQTYLKAILKGKQPISFTRLNLDGWNGNSEELKAILHHRGFNRLAKALFGCHPSLLWHVCHRLDTGRTKILRKFFASVNNQGVHRVLVEQVLTLISIIQEGP